jgi:hypothetical protein
MGWESRNYDRVGRGGGFRAAAGRIFGSADSPLGWSLKLYRAWGIQVRIHLFFLIMIVWQLVAASFRGTVELQYAAIWIGGLFLLVLLHEYGHCFACRWVGGTAHEILMWPLGGLAFCAPPQRWKANLITAAGGPAVNVVLWVLLGGVIGSVVPAADRAGALVFSPFSPGFAMLSVHLPDGSRPLWLTILWWLYLDNAALLLFNMVLVMYPMDAGRIVRDILWARIGYARATSIVASIGLLVASGLFLYGMFISAWVLTSLAIFGGLTCYVELKQQQALSRESGVPATEYDFDRGYRGMPGADEEDRAHQRRVRAEQKRRQQEAEEQAELDRILAKIAHDGMASLTTSEKRWLERATERRRRA